MSVPGRLNRKIVGRSPPVLGNGPSRSTADGSSGSTPISAQMNIASKVSPAVAGTTLSEISELVLIELEPQGVVFVPADAGDDLTEERVEDLRDLGDADQDPARGHGRIGRLGAKEHAAHFGRLLADQQVRVEDGARNEELRRADQ